MIDAAVRSFFDRIGRVAGAPLLVQRPVGLAAALGQVSSEPIMLASSSPNNATEHVLWTTPIADYPWALLDSGDQTLRVNSSAGADDGAPLGTGARTVRLWWLNAAGIESTTDLVMDGATLVDGPTTARRVNRLEVLTAGSGGRNAGTLRVYATDGVTLLAQSLPIASFPGSGNTNQAHQTVPAGKRDILTGITVNTTGNALAWYRINLYTRTSPTSPWIRRWLRGLVTVNILNGETLPPLVLEAGTDYYLTTVSNGSFTTVATLVGRREAA